MYMGAFASHAVHFLLFLASDGAAGGSKNPCQRSPECIPPLIRPCVLPNPAMYMGAFAPHAVHFLLFLAIAPTLVVLLATPFINHVPFVQRSELASEQQFFAKGGSAARCGLYICLRLPRLASL